MGKTGHAIKCKFLKNGLIITDFKEVKKYKIVKCLNCGNDIKGSVRKFCNSSCSAIYNNKKRDIKINEKIRETLKNPKQIKKIYCLNCEKELFNKSRKYCNGVCLNEFRYKNYIEKWKNGEVDGMSGDDQISKYIKKYLLIKYEYKCSEDGWNKVNPFTKKIPLEVEHIDGNNRNNKEENLKLLCPCCHSLTKTYKGANRGNGRHNRLIRYRKNADVV